MKIKAFKHGHVTLERGDVSGLYSVRCYCGDTLHDKVVCDTYRAAMEYFRAFCRIARFA